MLERLSLTVMFKSLDMTILITEPLAVADVTPAKLDIAVAKSEAMVSEL